MRMLKDNFECALSIAIRAQEEIGNDNVIFTDGLREVLAASEKGETITIEQPVRINRPKPGDADEPAHYIKPDTDCMGGPVPGYWRQFLVCSDDKVVIGTGASKEAAEAAASVARADRESQIAQHPLTQLRELVKDKSGLCSRDLDRTVRLIIAVLLEDAP